MDSDTIRFIREEIRRQLNVVTSGQAGTNSSIETETIQQALPGMPDMVDRPVAHPFGFASRATPGTLQVNVRQGSDPGNRLTIGHRDKVRADLDVGLGEAMIYASDGVTVLSSIKVSDDVTIETELLTVKIGAAGTLAATNETGEFTAAIIQLFTDIMGGLTDTLIGPQPLVMPTFIEDLAILQTFKG